MSSPPTTTVAMSRERGVVVEGGLHADAGGEDGLAQHDDREQAVALGDVVGVPRGATGALGPQRHRQLSRHQHEERGHAHALGQRQPGDPEDLEDADSHGVAPGARPPVGMRRGRPQPQPHHRHPHHHVAGHDHPEVAAVEDPGNAGGHDQHPGHEHQHGQAVGGVVGVVGRREPGEVHPRPPDPEEHEGVGDEGIADVAPDQPVVEAARGLGDGHHEGEVEEQLQRGGRPVGLVRVPGRHAHVQLHAAIVPNATGSC